MGGQRLTWLWTPRCLRPGWRVLTSIKKCKRWIRENNILLFNQELPDNLDLVVVLLYKWAECQPEPLVRPHWPIHAEDGPWCFVPWRQNLAFKHNFSDVSGVHAILLLQFSIKFLHTCKSPSSWEVRFLAPPFSNLKPWTVWKGGCFFKILYHHILFRTTKTRKGFSIGGPRPWSREHSSASPLSSPAPAARPPEKPGWVNTKS